MFIRGRQSTRRMSYQVIETYRDGGKVKQRILANLGSHPTLEEAVAYARHYEIAWRERFLKRGESDQDRTEDERQEARANLARERERLAKLEAVVSEMRSQRRFSDTTLREKEAEARAKYEKWWGDVSEIAANIGQTFRAAKGNAPTCNFCGGTDGILVKGDSAFICEPCIEKAARLVQEQKLEAAA